MNSAFNFLKITSYLFRPLAVFVTKLNRAFQRYVKNYFYTCQMGYCGKNVIVKTPRSVPSWKNVLLYDNTNILWGFTFISNGGKFIMKNGSGAAQGLTVITGNHQRTLGQSFKNAGGLAHPENDIEKDVIVEEDVWLGANVTLLSGVTIGRGATVGAGTVCLKSVPPYAIVMGNPAKIVGFSFTPEEIAKHEKLLYDEADRLPIDVLQKNYEKYFINKILDIKQFNKL